MILPDFYIKVETDAVHAYGGLLVLDCIASGGTLPYAGMVMMYEAGMAAVKANQSNSFAVDLGK